MSAPEKLTIDTPEQVALDFSLASAGSRFLALAIDTLLQAAGFLVLFVVGAFAVLLRLATGTDVATWMLAAVILLFFLLYSGYFAAFEAAWGGQTPGKRLIGLRVIATSGRPISTLEAILRNLLRIVDQLPGIYAVGILSIFFTERNQRLGDLAAGTVVVHERPLDHQHLAYRKSASGGGRAGAAHLTDEEAALIETFLRRRTDLPGEIREQTARQIARRLSHRLGLPLDAADHELLLEELIGAYREIGRYR